MTVQAGNNVATMDGVVLDAPIFDPHAFRIPVAVGQVDDADGAA